MLSSKSNAPAWGMVSSSNHHSNPRGFDLYIIARGIFLDESMPKVKCTGQMLSKVPPLTAQGVVHLIFDIDRCIISQATGCVDTINIPISQVR